MMFSRNARYLLQRAISSPTKAQVSRQSFATSVPKGAAAAQQAAPSHQQQQQQDLVRSAIEGLLEKQQFNHHDDDSDAIQQQHGIEDRELKTRVEEFESLFEEARLCVKDCHEAKADSEEYVDAGHCVDDVFALYQELVEDLRRANESQQQQYSRLRVDTPNSLKKLRHEYDEILEHTKGKEDE